MRLMGSARVIACVLVVLLAGALAAQQPVFRAGTDYVQLDVVVTDKDGQAIRDLSKDDFEVTENGRSQAVTDLQFVAFRLCIAR